MASSNLHSISGRHVTRRQALGTLGAFALPWDRLLAQSGSRPGAAVKTAGAALPPDLVNLHPLMEWMAGERPMRHSFLDSQWRDLETWKKTARPLFRELLRYDPKPQPMQADLLRRDEREGFTIEVINIHATPAYKIPAWVLVPSKPGGRRPAVVGLHSHGGRYVWGHEKLISHPNDSTELIDKRNAICGRPWAESLVRRGFIVIVIDAFYFGERRLRVEDIPADRVITEARDACTAARTAKPDSPEWHRGINRGCSLYESLTAKNLFTAGVTWPGLHTWDDMRTVDYLVSRPDVDPERIGCGGLSIGGLRSAHLIAADPRIKAAFITGWMTQFAQQHRNHLRNHTWMIYIPGLYGEMDFPDAAALHAPGALLVQQCRQDQLYPLAAMQGAVDKLAKIYIKAGIPERFRGTFYDVPHVFRPNMQDEVFEWFERWL